MHVQILKPVQVSATEKLPSGSVHDASTWRNTEQLLALRYIKEVPAPTPEPEKATARKS